MGLVITSYSIHYTKLYDAARGAIHVDWGLAREEGAPAVREVIAVPGAPGGQGFEEHEHLVAVVGQVALALAFVVGVGERRGRGVEAGKLAGDAGLVIRITSYNVCYTKLLRALFKSVLWHTIPVNDDIGF